MKNKILLITLLCLFGMFSVKATKLSVAEVPNRTYVIGKHMLTRVENEETKYDGRLTTKIIMLASQTATGNIDDMIIYYKNLEGNWIDALTGELVEDVDLSDIEYYNLAKIPDKDLIYSKKEDLTDKVEYTLEMKNNVEINLSDFPSNEYSTIDAKVYYDLYGSANEADLNSNNYVEDEDNLTISYDGDLVKSKVSLTETYKVNVNKNSSYYYRPNFYLDDDGYKIYLTEGQILALDSGVTVSNKIVNGKMEVELAGIDNYTINEVTLYVPIDMENDKEAHISPADLSSALKQVTNKDELMLSTNLGLATNILVLSTMLDYNNQKYQIANVVTGELGKKVSISDLGNVENEENSYIVLVKYSDTTSDYGTQRTIISDAVNGIVAQEIMPAGEFDLNISSEEPTEFLPAAMFAGTMVNLILSLLTN